MYIMKKMNREKKAATEEERNLLLLAGYVDVTPVKNETSKEAETPVEEQAEELSDTDVKEEKKVSKKKV